MNTSLKSGMPFVAGCAWVLSAMAGAAGLAMAYGLGGPMVAPVVISGVLGASVGLFVLSRLFMLLPLSRAGERLREWWGDYVLLIAAIGWWLADRSSAYVILRLGAGYSLVLGTGILCGALIRTLAEGLDRERLASGVRRLFAGAILLVLIGGAALMLPICWEGPYPVLDGHPYVKYQFGMHALECLFTATAALTGTGLAVCDIGYQFSHVGQVVILVLMQIGGLAVLVIGSVVGWRFRHAIGWGSSRDDMSSVGIRRLVRFVIVMAFFVEAVGTVVLAATRAPGAFEHGGDMLWHWFDCAFLSVSAFCNVGLVLSRNSLINHGQDYALYGAILPLMVVGSIGGPVLYDLFRAFGRRRDAYGQAGSRESRVTWSVTFLLILLGAAALYATESSKRWQLRYPRDDTTGRLMLATRATSLAGEEKIGTAQPGQSQRMQTMKPDQRVAASLFHSIAARTCGMQAARLDEASLSPGGRVLLTLLMLMGGGLGGTAGGLRIVMVWLLIGSIFLRRPADDEIRTCGRSTQLQRGIATAAALAAALFLLISMTTFTLVYREAGSVEACLFEAVSACCNVGFSAGLTPQLSVQGQVAVILAMLGGRVIPLVILLSYITRPVVNDIRHHDPLQPMSRM